MTKIRIAQAQINPTVGDFKSNYKKILSYIEKADTAQADFVIFPELSVCGYPPEDLLFRNNFLEMNKLCLKKIVKYLYSTFNCIERIRDILKCIPKNYIECNNRLTE